MNEKDIHTAQTLLATKRELQRELDLILDKTTSEIILNKQVIHIRASVLKELLDKEVNYVNRRLKSLGITEIT